MSIIEILKEVGISGIFDIVFLSILIYTVIIFFKRTKAVFVLVGIGIISIIYLLSKQFNLILTASVFHQFFAVILIVVVVIFQEELRRFFEQVAMWSLRDRSPLRSKLKHLTRKEVEIIIRVSTELAKERIGGIIVITGKDPIVRHLEGGISLNGELSESLLKSILDPHSPGHDGAVIIEQNKITQFGCMLPLSKDFQKLHRRGTRHAAGLGLAELTDALCIVISEERGTISIAKDGDMYQVNEPEKLNLILERFYREITPVAQVRPLHDYFRKNTLEKVFSILISVILWFVLVHESRLVYKSFSIPIKHADISQEFILKEIKPPEAKVTLSGSRRNFYFFNKEELKLFVQLLKLKEGINSVTISRTDLLFPADFTLINIEPREVKVITEKNKNG